jgi:DNA primase
MRFSPDFIEKVRDANNIVDLISQHTQLRPMAGGYMGRCPFPDHQEKTPSFSVSETKQVYNCFGCHKKGNIFTFVQEFNGMNFPEAIEYLAGRANITLPAENPQENSQQDLVAKKKKAILHLNKLALQYFTESYHRLTNSHPVRQYAQEKRGLSEETLREFQVGYAPKEWDGLVSFLKGKGANLLLAEEARLIKRRNEGDGYIDIFRDRLMFPIFNPMNDPVAFGGRIIAQGEPKYLNSGETLVFNKGKILYGLSQTARHIRSEDQAVVVEGYMDLVSLYQAVIKTGVAPMGTALTQDQCRLLARMTKNVIVLFDGDEAGQRAAERSLPILLNSEVHPKGLILPEGMDPDDFVKSQGADALTTLFSTAPDLFSMVLGIWTRGYRGEASDKVNMSDLLKPIFVSMQDVRIKKLYLQEAAKKLGVEETWLRDAIRGVENRRAPTPLQTPSAHADVVPVEKIHSSESTESVPERVSLKGTSKVEGLLLRLALKNTSHFEYLQKSGAVDLISHSGVRSVLEKAAVAYRQTPERFDKLAGLLTSFVDMPELLLADATMPTSLNGVTGLRDSSNQLLQDEVAREIAMQQQRESEIESDKQMLIDCVKRLKAESLKLQADKLAADIKREPTPEKLERLMKIQRDRLDLNKEKE